jgi:hypothetical protein
MFVLCVVSKDKTDKIQDNQDKDTSRDEAERQDKVIRKKKKSGGGEIFHTGPWAHHRVFCPGIKRPGRGVHHPPSSSAEVEERVELYIYSPSWGTYNIADVFCLYQMAPPFF